MCLITKNKKEKITIFGKTCYKVLLYKDGDLFNPMTTYGSVRYKNGINHTDDIESEPEKVFFEEGNPFGQIPGTFFGYSIGKGYLFAFKNASTACSFRDVCHKINPEGSYLVFKSKIPPLTRYYESYDGSELCTKSLNVKTKKSVD